MDFNEKRGKTVLKAGKEGDGNRVYRGQSKGENVTQVK